MRQGVVGLLAVGLVVWSSVEVFRSSLSDALKSTQFRGFGQ
jgi:hypothetical protein